MLGRPAVEFLKRVARRIPGLRRLYQRLRAATTARRLRRATIEQVFTDIYRHNRWGGAESASGTGSAQSQTMVIAMELPVLLREMRVTSVLDLPCGDFHWMRNVDLNGITYIGGDIVHELVRRNQEFFGRPGVSFRQLDIVSDRLPRVDMIVCRDCLVHLSFEDIFRALGNLCSSGSEYLLATTFSALPQNRDILTGDWRPLNLEVVPFNLPRPLRAINEGCTEGDGAYKDKSLGLWRLTDVTLAVSAQPKKILSGRRDET